MNRSLNIRSQLRAITADDAGRASVRKIAAHVDIECGCHAKRPRRPTHEILVSRWGIR